MSGYFINGGAAGPQLWQFLGGDIGNTNDTLGGVDIVDISNLPEVFQAHFGLNPGFAYATLVSAMEIALRKDALGVGRDAADLKLLSITGDESTLQVADNGVTIQQEATAGPFRFSRLVVDLTSGFVFSTNQNPFIQEVFQIDPSGRILTNQQIPGGGHAIRSGEIPIYNVSGALLGYIPYNV